ncbi:MAG: GNAT family N-acetyltransferase [Bryobacteraceae bacterium]|nr:GNAT family N-acetyltransferase [Bryobacteraceae bacterium]
MLNPIPAAQTGSVFPPPVTAAAPDGLIVAATPADAKRCIEVLTLAFENDPPSRWIWPDWRLYLDAFPRFVQAFGGRAIDLATAHYYQGFAGVALWLPPGATPDDESLAALIRETVPRERRDSVFSLFDEMGAYHPHELHWHLPLIGVRPDSQGRGVGSALMRHMLQQCDRRRTAAYLEATSPANVRLYERLGFHPLGRIQTADCPPVVPMLRNPH